MKTMQKEEALRAYGEGRVRKLFVITGKDARMHFVPGDELWNAVRNAENVENTFITFDGESFGLYEVIGR